MRTIPKTWGWSSWLVLWSLLLGLWGQGVGQNYDPLGYWRFESGTATVDASGNGYHVANNFAGLVIEPNGVAGGCYAVPATGGLPSTAANLDDSAQVDRVLSVEFWYRSDSNSHEGLVSWEGKAEVVFGSSFIRWSVYVTDSPAIKNLIVGLTGTNLADPHYIYNGDWHHYVATYDAYTGEQKLYVDGHCPAGFSVVHGPTAAFMPAGVLFFSHPAPSSRMLGHLDEFAVYDTVIPHALVWQHFQEGLAGQPYTFTVGTASVPPLPPPSSIPGINPLEFGPQYPNVNLQSVQLIQDYPMPRYGSTPMRKLIPWMADAQNISGGSNDIERWNSARFISERLAHDWNNYLFCGELAGMNNLLNGGYITNPSYAAHHFVNMMNAPENQSLERFMFMFWGFSKPGAYNPSFPDTAYIINRFHPLNSLPDYWFLRDSISGNITIPPLSTRRVLNYSMANPLYPNDTRLDSLSQDGLGSRAFISNLFQYTNDDYLDFLGENDEMQFIEEWSVTANDSGIIRDMNANGFVTGINGDFRRYQAQRITRMRQAYQDSFLLWLGDQNLAEFGGNHRSPENWWFELKGGNSADVYGEIRNTLRYRDGIMRPGPTFYPQGPSGWLIGGGANPGWLMVCKDLRYQQMRGDSLFIPAVSAGFEHQPTFYVTDERQIRPGCYLGILKSMHLLGAESFNTFEYQGNVPLPDANWRIWKMVMPSYAQAIGSRTWEFWDNGEVLIGDTAFTYSNGTAPTFFSFASGNQYDLVTARKQYGVERYLISGTVQRSSNEAAQGPKFKDAQIRLRRNDGTPVYNQFLFGIRNQGSTYVLDETVSPSVFYQLDSWHEWKDPWHWCRDFIYEAEVWDSAHWTAARKTELPLGTAAGDYREFTSYVELRNPGEQLDYRFRPRNNDQYSLYLWVRARLASGSSAQIIGKVDGAQADTLILTDTTWVWVGRDATSQPLLYSTPDTLWHTLNLSLLSGDVDLDVVALKRSSADFTTQPFTGLIVASNDTTCVRDTIQFNAGGSVPDGCIDYHWRFGDGGQSYESSAPHAYANPGTYEVILGVTSTCNDSTVFDTMTVFIYAPFVDAGAEQVMCPGDSVTLSGAAFGTFSWNPNSSISATNVLNPVVWPSQQGWYYLQADTLGGCSMVDSVLVTPLTIDLIWRNTVYTCPGQSQELKVWGAYRIEWLPHPTLVGNNIPNPIVTPLETTDYPFWVTDIWGCDTLFGSVKVIVPGMAVPDTVVCYGNTLTMEAVGGETYFWPQFNSTNSSVSATFLSDTMIFVEVVAGHRLSCTVMDTMFVEVDSMPLFSLLSSDTLICYGDTITISAEIGANSYAWSPSGSLGNGSAPLTTAFPDSSTTYFLSSANGCLVNDSIRVEVDSLPLLGVLTLDTVVCYNDTITLSAELGANSYAWSPSGSLGNAAAAVTPAFPGLSTMYYLSMGSVNGCMAEDSVYLEVDSLPIGLTLLPEDSVLCLGDSLLLHFDYLYGNVDSVLWWNGATSDSVWFVTSATDTVFVTVRDYAGTGCVARDSIVLVADTGCCNVPGATRLVGTHRSSTWALPTTNGFYHIMDTLLIDDAITFTSTDFYMGAGSVILVEDAGSFSGGQLTTYACHFRSACRDSMWEGIILEGANAEMEGTSDTIANAVRGVWSRHGAWLTLTEEVFERNWVGVRVDSSTGSSYPLAVEGCSFKGGNLLPPYDHELAPWAGIEVDAARGVVIGVVSGLTNYFEGLHYGVHGSNVDLTLRNNAFHAMIPGGSLTGSEGSCVYVKATQGGVGFTRRLVTGLQTGDNPVTLYQYRNTMDSSLYGVFVDGSYETYVRGNHIDEMGQTGIYVRKVSSRAVKLDYNEVWNSSLGVHVADLNNVSGGVRGNEITADSLAIRRGIRMDLVQHSSLTGNDSTYGFQAVDNYLILRGDGVWAVDCDHVGIDSNHVAVKRKQGLSSGLSAGVHVAACQNMRVLGNLVLGNGSALADTLYGWGVYVTMSPETDMRCNELADWGRCVVWEDVCNDSRMLGNFMRDSRDGLVLMNLGEIGPQGSITRPSENNWDVASIKRWQTLTVESDGLGSPFFVRNATGFRPPVNENYGFGDTIPFTPLASAGGFEYCPQGEDDGGDGTGDGDALRQAIEMPIGEGDYQMEAQWRTDTWTYSELLRTPELMVGDSLFEDYHISIYGQDVGLLVEAGEAIREGNLTEAKMLEGTVEGGIILADNQKLSYQKRIMALDSNFTGFDILSLGIMEAVALQCPLSGGKAVHQLRAQLAGEGMLIWTGEGCVPSFKGKGQAAAGSDTDTFGLEVWPNPADKSLQIRFLGSPLSVWVEVIDSYGQTICKVELGKSETIDVDTHSFSSGLYLVRASSEAGRSWEKRVIIVH